MSMDRREALSVLAGIPVAAITSVERVAVNPTDVIVLELGATATYETMARLKSKLQEVWPDNKCLVFDATMRLKVVSAA